MGKFATQFMKQQQFAIGVKIFPFDNRVVSLHLIVVRIEKGTMDQNEDDDDGVQDRKPAAESKKAEPEESKGKEKINLFKKKKGGESKDNPQGGSFDPGPKIPLKK